MQPSALVRWSLLAAAAVLATNGGAQVAGAPGSFPPDQRAPEAQTQPASAPISPAKPDAQNAVPGPAGAAYAASPVLGTPAEPAQVKLTAGKLSIQAKNSSLSDILHQLSKDTGMSIDGLTKDQRIFGIYGPADPRAVLSDLLDGAGYNVLMLGSTDSGTPRELQLSMRNGGAAAVTQPTVVAQQQQQDEDQDDTAPIPQYPPAGEVVPRAPVPVNQVAPTPNGGVKTPQQLLQELERMRRQQQQQQQPQ